MGQRGAAKSQLSHITAHAATMIMCRGVPQGVPTSQLLGSFQTDALLGAPFKFWGLFEETL